MGRVYDLLDEFSGELAAKLIAGSNDNAANQDAYKGVLAKLRLAYEMAFDHYVKLSGEGWTPRPTLSAEAIRSKSMLTCERTLEHEPRGGTFSGWLTQKSMTGFASQEFTHAELAGWLHAIGLESVYPFAPKASQVEVHNVKDQKTTDGTQGIPAPKRPALLNNISHSTKTRRHTLTPVIEFAQSQCQNRLDTAEVWAALQVLAEKKHPPLIGATEEGLQYLKGGEVMLPLKNVLHS